MVKKKKVTLTEARKVANLLYLDLKKIPLKEWRYAMEVELEHGTQFGLDITNVTNDDLLLTGKIALAHYFEFPDYYRRLEKMEKKAEEYWKHRKKPNLLLF